MLDKLLQKDSLLTRFKIFSIVILLVILIILFFSIILIYIVVKTHLDILIIKETLSTIPKVI